MDNWTLLFLTLATIGTSGFAAIIGQGGGLILFAILAIYIDLPVLIALHAVIQLVSNSSRAALALPHIHWPVIRPILMGIIIGAIIITPLLENINWQWMTPLMGLYILYMTWGKKIKLPFSLPFPLVSTGLLQGSLGMALGATGPLTNALLLAKGLSKDAIVASNAVIMSLSHLMKIILFTLLGISLLEFALPLVFLCVAAILGSYLGSHLRSKIPEHQFMWLFKIILTVLAIRLTLSNLSI
ncbi:MAG: sulfite exporter TauE/SafE family protein [Gammaproteobacteria bacterium]|nr:sulfite exporter TauE/SafE family protein [Gammaproteobacteria bacterium]